MHNFEARKVTFVVSHLVMGLDRWAHDGGRPWRQGHQLEEEGFKGFQKRFGASAFALHHRFYLHLDVRVICGCRLKMDAREGQFNGLSGEYNEHA